MKKTISTAGLIVLFAAVVALAQPQQQQRGGHGQPGQGGMMQGKGMMMRQHGGMMMGAGIGMILMHKDDLKLTADQVSKLQKMRSDATKDGIKRQADIKTAMVDVSESMMKQPPDFAGAKANVKKAMDLKTAAKTAMIDNFANAYNVLTKDQQNMLPSFMMRGGCCMGDDDEDED